MSDATPVTGEHKCPSTNINHKCYCNDSPKTWNDNVLSDTAILPVGSHRRGWETHRRYIFFDGSDE